MVHVNLFSYLKNGILSLSSSRYRLTSSLRVRMYDTVCGLERLAPPPFNHPRKRYSGVKEQLNGLMDGRIKE
jgi:hypothetical protein